MRRLTRRFLSRTAFRHQLVLAFAVGIGALAVISSVAVSALSSRTVQDTLMEQGMQATEAFAAQSTLALLYHSAENAEQAAKATLAFPDIRAVAIYTLEHTALLERGESDAFARDVEVWPDSPRLATENGSRWEFMSPVYAQPVGANEESPFATVSPAPQLLGYVRVIMSKGTLHTLGTDILRGNFVVLMGLSGLLLLALLAMTNRLTRPLKNLAGFMRRAEQGEPGVRASVSGPRDISEMESAFNTMMEVLEAREDELKTARDMALESARAKGEFAANVSHELRTPLNSVLGMLELLQGMGLTAKQREYADIARTSGESLLRLIDDILDFSKLDARKVELAPVDFDVRDLFEEVVALLAGQAQRKDIELGYIIRPGVPDTLVGEPARIRQLLINLIGNAIKFTDEGEVAVEARLEERAADGVRVCFEVRDTGIGIAEQARERIFQAFSQADGSTTRKYGGTGLGLAICSQLVDLMGGRIGVDSEPGRGSRFWFVLPLGHSEKSSETHTDRRELAGVRILIVEDSAVNRIFLEEMFASWGADHSSSDDAQQALEILRDACNHGRPYDIAIIDAQLPGVRGEELVCQIVAHPDIAPLRLALLVGQQSSALRGSSPAGVCALIEKPIRAMPVYTALLACMRGAAPALIEGPAPGSLRESTAEAVALYGRRVLIVEDNVANQQVAAGMLERLGCMVEIVATGVDAVDAVVRNSYDAVLMDCQMPGMDGYEATARVRSIEKGERRVPIIAMTANVQRGDAEKCIASGMDDYLPKPLKLGALREKLTAWIGGEAVANPHLGIAEVSERPYQLEPTSSDGPLDLDVYRELRESVGDAFGRMIEVFLEDAPRYIEAVEAALAADDAQALRNSAHSLKGSARNFGATALAAAAYALEERGRAGEAADDGDLVGRLREEYRQVRNVLRHEVGPAAEIHNAADPQGHPRVLIVDDDRGMRYALRNVLEEDGYRIEEASNGAVALAYCERHMPDLVLMDALMPVMDGFEACARLRELPGSDHTPVLIITALDDESSIESAFAAGAKDYIPKPVHFAVLRQRVARLLKASRAEKHVRQLAYQDMLTGLANRAQFNEYLNRLLERQRPEGEMLAVLFLDLDRFKIVNDTLGHDVGDLLLKAVAERIVGCVRTSDLVARLGGDEFTVVLDGIKQPKVVASISEKICSVLAKPFVFMGQEMYVTTSIGISIYPMDGTDSGTLIKHADTAMFRAKERGNHFQFYEYGMESAVSRRLELDSELRRALAREELIVHYQPQAEVESGRIIGMEALVRWQHPERGLIPPSDFIPIAEETGLIVPLGEWVLHAACSQLKRWIEAGYEPVKVSINLSGRQLERPDIAASVERILQDTGLPADLLELEITESTIMARAGEVIPVLQKLKTMGVTLAVDDFGTGYSSLNYLKRFPIDVLKVDRSFVVDIAEDADAGAILTAIIVLAASLRLKVVAEGVETADQHAFLREHGCDRLQGYYLSRALSADEFAERFLEHGPRGPRARKVQRLR